MAAWLIGLGWLALGAAPVVSCAMSPADRAWIDRAIGEWRLVEREVLKLPPAPLPTIVAVDASCTYADRLSTHGRLSWVGVPNRDGKAMMPDGKAVPIGPISFAAPADTAAGGYFAMSLPSVWRAAGVRSGLGLERLMDGVLLHELMHTRQFHFANPALAAVSKRYGLGDDIGDDSLQDRFKTDPAYVRAYDTERDLLYAAAAAPSDAEARRLAGRALAAMRARRTRWFTGAQAYWGRLDDIF